MGGNQIGPHHIVLALPRDLEMPPSQPDNPADALLRRHADTIRRKILEQSKAAQTTKPSSSTERPLPHEGSFRSDHTAHSENNQ